jgi:hypothetical protein
MGMGGDHWQALGWDEINFVYFGEVLLRKQSRIDSCKSLKGRDPWIVEMIRERGLTRYCGLDKTDFGRTCDGSMAYMV